MMVCRFGGYHGFVGKNVAREVAERLNVTEMEVKRDYLKYLYHYERIAYPESMFNMTFEEDGVMLADLKPNLLQEVAYSVLEGRRIRKDTIQFALDADAYLGILPQL